MTRQLSLLASENQRLRDDLAATQAWTSKRTKEVQEEHGQRQRLAQMVMEENVKLKDDLRQLSLRLDKQEEDATFATLSVQRFQMDGMTRQKRSQTLKKNQFSVKGMERERG